jgi:hypothetical protein
MPLIKMSIMSVGGDFATTQDIHDIYQSTGPGLNVLDIIHNILKNVSQ